MGVFSGRLMVTRVLLCWFVGWVSFVFSVPAVANWLRPDNQQVYSDLGSLCSDYQQDNFPDPAPYISTTEIISPDVQGRCHYVFHHYNFCGYSDVASSASAACAAGVSTCPNFAEPAGFSGIDFCYYKKMCTWGDGSPENPITHSACAASTLVTVSASDQVTDVDVFWTDEGETPPEPECPEGEEQVFDVAFGADIPIDDSPCFNGCEYRISPDNNDFSDPLMIKSIPCQIDGSWFAADGSPNYCGRMISINWRSTGQTCGENPPEPIFTEGPTHPVSDTRKTTTGTTIERNDPVTSSDGSTIQTTTETTTTTGNKGDYSLPNTGTGTLSTIEYGGDTHTRTTTTTMVTAADGSGTTTVIVDDRYFQQPYTVTTVDPSDITNLTVLNYPGTVDSPTVTTSTTTTHTDTEGRVTSTNTSIQGENQTDSDGDGQPDGDSNGEGDGEGDCDPTIEECGQSGDGYGQGAALPSLDDAPSFGDSLGEAWGILQNSQIAQAVRSIAPPSVSSSCPTPAFDVFGSHFVMDSHCAIWENNKGVLSSVFLVLWGLAAVILFLKA